MQKNTLHKVYWTGQSVQKNTATVDVSSNKYIYYFAKKCAACLLVGLLHIIWAKRANWSVMLRSNKTCVYLSCRAAIGSKHWLDLSRCLKEHKNSKWRCVGSRDLGQKHPIRNQAGKQNRAPQGAGLQKRGYTHFEVARRIPLAVKRRLFE